MNNEELLIEKYKVDEVIEARDMMNRKICLFRKSNKELIVCRYEGNDDYICRDCLLQMI